MEKFLTSQLKQTKAFKSLLPLKAIITKKERNVIHDKAIEAVIKDSCAFNVFNKPGIKAFINYLNPAINHQIEKQSSHVWKKSKIKKINWDMIEPST